MAVNAYDAVAEKILLDLEMAIRRDTSINEFDVLPTSETENRNSSPILKGECSLGLESWIVPHIYPFAHHQIMQKSNYKTQNLEKVISCLVGVALLNPEMSTVWSRRRELILSRKMSADNELRLTRMALSRKPKSNEALAHRRWIITEILKDVKDKTSLLQEELTLSQMIADRYHSNYHAWSHRMWSFQHLLPNSHKWNAKKKLFKRESSPADMFAAISQSKYLSMINSDVFRAYSDELDNNFKWVSSHVSDNSGFHFRKFLMSEIFEFLKIQSSSVGDAGDGGDGDGDDVGVASAGSVQCKSAFFANRKAVLVEFLTALDNDNRCKETVDEYLIGLEENHTLFDLIMSVVVSEMKSNHALCAMFRGHEALWYYRRCLMHFFKQCILDGSRRCEEQAILCHQDKNGVPHRKDFKYDYSVKSSDERKLDFCEVTRIFHAILVKREEDALLTVVGSCDEHERKLVADYENWFKYCLRVGEKRA